MPVPRSERLSFRRMIDSDLDSMASLLGDPNVMEFYPHPKTRDEAQAWIDWNTANYATHGFGLWIIETAAGEFVGDCGLTWQNVNGERMLEVGYHVRRDLQGKGYATEAAAACRDYARDELGVSDIVAIIHPDNIASQRVAKKIGLRYIGDDLDGAIVRSVYATAASRPQHGH